MNALQRAYQRLKAWFQRVLQVLGAIALTLLVLVGTAWHQGWHLPGGAPPSVPASPSPEASASAFPSPTVAPHDSNRLRLGLDGRAASLPFWGIRECLDNEAGSLQIDIEKVEDAGLRWQLLSAGRLDLACGPLDSFALAATTGRKGVIVFRTGISHGSDCLVASKSIHQVSQLAHKRIALVAGHPGAYWTHDLLKRVKLSYSDVHFVEVDTMGDAKTLLDQGMVEAAWLGGSFVGDLDLNDYTCLADTSEQSKPTEICAISPHALETSKPQVQAVLKAWFKMVNHIKQDPGLARAPLVNHSGLKSEVVGRLLEQTEYFGAEDNHRQKLDSTQLADEMNGFLDFFRLAGALGPTQGRGIDVNPLIHLEWAYEVDGPPTPSVLKTGDKTPAAH